MNEFETLVDTHYQPLYRFALSLAKNQERAADLVQQTFLKWAQKGHQLRERSKAKTWLFTTLYREFLGHARRASKYQENDIADMEYQLPVHESQVERKMDADRVVALLGQLDDIFRIPLALFYLQQHSYKEIAAILEIPMGTVMSRISRAKAQLRGMMETTPTALVA